MPAADSLLILLDEVRGKTLQILEAARDEWLTWAPPGTQNHIAWHAGHCAWVTDVLITNPITGKEELPTTWAATFGQHGTPPAMTTSWPARTDLLRRLRDQHARLRQLLSPLTDEQLFAPPRQWGGPRPLAYFVTHALHDEANHQGEMYLLLKMCRARSSG